MQTNKQAVLAAQAAATHKLVATNARGKREAFAYSDEVTLQAIKQTVRKHLNPVVMLNV